MSLGGVTYEESQRVAAFNKEGKVRWLFSACPCRVSAVLSVRILSCGSLVVRVSCRVSCFGLERVVLRRRRLIYKCSPKMGRRISFRFCLFVRSSVMARRQLHSTINPNPSHPNTNPNPNPLTLARPPENKKGLKVVLGGSTIHNSKTFLKELDASYGYIILERQLLS